MAIYTKLNLHYYRIFMLIELDKINWAIPEHVILKDISIKIRPNKLTIIMGSSGSGKTSLLNIMSGKLKRDEYEGNITFNDHGKFSYVHQEDILPLNLTPLEYLGFVNEVKNLNLAMDDLLDKFDIHDAKDTIINEMGSGLSGGQRKKLSIAIAGMSRPSILFLDEPTTGLDSLSALAVINFLKNETIDNSSVVATIHQPSYKILNQFDDIIILHENRIFFYGSIKGDLDFTNSIFGNEGIIKYLDSLGFVYDEKEWGNISDYLFIKVLPNCTYDEELNRFVKIKHNQSQINIQKNLNSVNIDKEIQKSSSNHLYKNSYSTVSFKSKSIYLSTESNPINNNLNNTLNNYNNLNNNQSISNISNSDEMNQNNNDNRKFIDRDFHELHYTNDVKQLYLLLQLQYIILKRNPIIFLARFLQSLITAILIAPVFFNIENKISNKQIYNKNITGFLYQMTLNNFYSIAFSSTMTFHENEKLLRREIENRMYRIYNYYIIVNVVQYLITLPLVIITPLIMLLSTQLTLSNLQYFIFIWANVFNGFVAYSFATFLSCLVGNNIIVTVVLSLILLPLATVTGLMADPTTLPFFYKMFQYISPTKYIFTIQIKNMFSNKNITNSDVIYNLYNGFVNIPLCFIILFFISIIFLFSGYFVFSYRIYKKL